MKLIFSFVLIALCSLSFTKPAPAEDAVIYIYRAGQFNAAANNWAIFVDGKKICKLSNNKFIKVNVTKGKHVISAKIGGVEIFKKQTDIEIEAEEGKSYYVACNVKQSFTRARLEMLEVTKSSADKQMVKMALDNCQESIDEKEEK